MTIFGDIVFTPRLRLRKIKEEDFSLLIEWSNSDTANGNYLSADKLTEDKIRDKYETGTLWSDKSKMFMIETKEGTPLGTIHYWLRSERTECAVVKVRISVPGQRGSGYGTEAQKYLIINLFDRLKVSDVEMYTDVNNKAQQRCLVKLGFELIESLTYDDHQVNRLGYLFRLHSSRYQSYPLYQYHYE